MNKLYTFNVNKKVKEEKRESNPDGSITLTYEDKLEPVRVFIKKPTLRERDDYSFVYDVAFSKAVTAGIQTWDMLRKSLLDSGGLDSRVDIEHLDKILKESQDLQAEYERLKDAGIEGEDIDAIQEKISKINKDYLTFQEKERSYFSKCAEARAQQKTIKWCVLNLLFYDVNPPTYVFQGLNDESRENSYYELAEKHENDSEDCVELKAFDKAFLFLEGWIKGTLKNEDDFKNVEEFIDAYVGDKS